MGHASEPTSKPGPQAERVGIKHPRDVKDVCQQHRGVINENAHRSGDAPTRQYQVGVQRRRGCGATSEIESPSTDSIVAGAGDHMSFVHATVEQVRPCGYGSETPTGRLRGRITRPMQTFTCTEGKNREGEIMSRINREEGRQFGEDLVRAVDVLARDECAVWPPVGALEHPLGRNSPRQRVCAPSFTGNHRKKLSAVLVEQAPCLGDAGWQVRQVFEHMNRDIPVEGPVLERKAL